MLLMTRYSAQRSACRHGSCQNANIPASLFAMGVCCGPNRRPARQLCLIPHLRGPDTRSGTPCETPGCWTRLGAPWALMTASSPHRPSAGGQVSHTQPAHVIGSGQATSPDMAAFANAVMVRYLDCNDNFFSVAGGHPSDMIPAALAVARLHPQQWGPSHDCYCRGISSLLLHSRPDTLGRTRLGPRGAGRAGLGLRRGDLMRLPPEQTREAISLAVTPNMALGQTRVGELSMWKGCATAASARAGVFAAMLAREGMSGPPEPFGRTAWPVGAVGMVCPTWSIRPWSIQMAGRRVQGRRVRLQVLPLADTHSSCHLDGPSLKGQGRTRPD